VKAAFGNWIRLRIVVTFLLAGLVIGAAMAAAAWLLAPDVRIQLAMWAVAALPLGIGLYLSYVYLMFGAGGVQRRLWNVVLDALVWDGSGEALDIGTGQGALAVMLAVRKPAARVIGVDLWAADWEYSKAACERNAVALGVQDRVRFERASAAALPFGDESMDAVVSSALCDLVSLPWLEYLADVLEVPFYASICVDGRDRFLPPHPGDAIIAAGFRRDQGRDKGFGPALGPQAPAAIRRVFEERGFSVASATSDWRLPRHATGILTEMVNGHATAARNQNRRQTRRIEEWRLARLAQTAGLRLSARIGHRDLLALPPTE